MISRLRVERTVAAEEFDAVAHRIVQEIPLYFPAWKDLKVQCRSTELFWTCAKVPRSELETAAKLALASSLYVVTSDQFTFAPHAASAGREWCLEKHFRFGVTDNSGNVLAEALALASPTPLADVQARSGRKIWLCFEKAVPRSEVEAYASKVFFNELIETCEILGPDDSENIQRKFSDSQLAVHFRLPSSTEVDVETIDVANLTVEEFVELSRKRLWAFSQDECETLIRHYRKLARAATDVEIEVFAQTWSEHCKHKIFAADIAVTNERDDLALPERVAGVFKTYIRGSTEKITKPYLRSVFHDNAGVIAIGNDHERVDVAIKVETHNSPSALDPYGGALTGIVGVNRDILGVGLGAEPIANLDVFCVGSLEHREELPERLHHPRRILEGVRSGVQDGGNKSGVPTVTGALVHDRSYLGKPLVFCGTIGVIPYSDQKDDLLTKEITSGDAIVMVGGRIGKDGIHGATFSSLELNQDSPASAVQLGDPLTQRRVWDFLLEARDARLYSAVTDNGAGGLSSSIGELARLCGQRGGAKLDLTNAKTKYPGLQPFELLVSESQERMSFAVPRSKIEEFLALASRRGVECSVLGTFEDNGIFEVSYRSQVVAKIDLHFLHEGCPRMNLNARVPKVSLAIGSARVGAWQSLMQERTPLKMVEALPQILASENVRSRRWISEQYDHEVGARSVRAPYKTKERGSPGDGGALRISRNTGLGVAVGIGLAPKIAAHDPACAAAVAVDEAFRNALVAGLDPDHAALVDNFCWPDPLPSGSNPDAEIKLGALVSTNQILHDAAIALGAPFVSGKDSMKNDYRMGSLKISVLPTILVTAIGKIHDVRQLPRGFCAGSNRSVYWIAASDPAPDGRGLPRVDFSRLSRFARAFHQAHREGWLESAHDVGDGGWLVTTAEMFFGTTFGIQIAVNSKQLPWLASNRNEPDWVGWFTESASGFVVMVEQKYEGVLEKTFSGFFVQKVGTTDTSGQIAVAGGTFLIRDLERAYGH